MISNLIPITVEAPLYPASYVEELRQRAGRAIPSLPDQAIDLMLCDLLAITSLDDIIDHRGLISCYETQPAISSSELDSLAGRILSYFDPEIPKSVIKRIVCSILNCVPRAVADLIDYMHPEDIAQINYMFTVSANLVDKIGFEKATSSELVPELLVMENRDAIHMAGAVIMDGHNTKALNADPGLPERQAYLRRAAEFYLLHLYGYPVASLWLAQHLNPMTFCHCSDVDCESRAFGFADAHGCVELVIQSLDYINETLARDSSKVVTASEVSYDDIVSSYMDLMLDAIEAALTIDQQRVRGSELQRIFELITQYQTLLDTPDLCRFLALNSVTQHLYPTTDILPPGVDNSEQLDVRSITATSEYTKGVSSRPPQKYLYLFDAHNFFAHGMNWEDPQMGARLRMLFLASLFDGKTIEEFSGIADMLIESDAAPNGLKEILVGFKQNCLGMLGRRGRAFPEILGTVGEHASSEVSIKELSELGCSSAISRRIERYLLGGSRSESDYWLRRLDLAEELEEEAI